MDSQFVAEPPKFIAGCLSALSAMVQLELPHVNMLTKVDLVQDKVRCVVRLRGTAALNVGSPAGACEMPRSALGPWQALAREVASIFFPGDLPLASRALNQFHRGAQRG